MARPARWRPIALVGVLNSAIPLLWFTVAALLLSTALMGIFNATAPAWAIRVAWVWLGERPAASRLLGLGIGLAGVLALSRGKAGFEPGDHGVSAAAGTAVCIGAAVRYGVAAIVMQRRLAGRGAIGRGLGRRAPT